MIKPASIAAAASLLLWVAPAHATWLGDSVDLEYLFPCGTCNFQDFGTQTVPATWNFFAEFATANATTVTVGTNGGVFWLNAAYNGFSLTDETTNPDITNVLLVNDTTGQVTQSDVSWTTDSISFNFEGQSWDAGSSATFDITFGAAAVPEPATLAIFGAALAGLGMVRRRNRKSA